MDTSELNDGSVQSLCVLGWNGDASHIDHSAATLNPSRQSKPSDERLPGAQHAADIVLGRDIAGFVF
ncbi:MAG: hypothetical protein WDO69_33560 [Pseudomonadota bacterium]